MSGKRYASGPGWFPWRRTKTAEAGGEPSQAAQPASPEVPPTPQQAVPPVQPTPAQPNPAQQVAAQPAQSTQEPAQPVDEPPRRGKWRRRLLIGIPILLVLLGVSAAVVIAGVGGNMAFTGDQAGLLQGVLSRPEPKDGVTVLLVGTDRRKEWKTARADAIAVVRIYPESSRAYVLTVPRGARVNIPGRGDDKATYTYTFGGPTLVIETMEEFLDIDVNYYVEFDYEGFARAIDDVGGVDFTVDQGYYSKELKVQVRGGRHRRMGREALALLKTREFAQGHAQRVQNQQKFLREASKQLVRSPSDIPKLVDTISKSSKTNMSIVDMARIGRSFVGGKTELHTSAIPGTIGNLNGETFTFVDEKQLREYVKVMKEDRGAFPASGP